MLVLRRRRLVVLLLLLMMTLLLLYGEPGIERYVGLRRLAREEVRGSVAIDFVGRKEVGTVPIVKRER